MKRRRWTSPIRPSSAYSPRCSRLLVEGGMTHVNEHSVDDTPTGPFGGEKNTGSGSSILREFKRDHLLSVRPKVADEFRHTYSSRIRAAIRRCDRASAKNREE